MAMSFRPETFNRPGVRADPSYSAYSITPIIPTSKLITVAGQAGVTANGTFPSDIKDQAALAYQAVLDTLKLAGSTPRDIIYVRHYVVTESGNAQQDQNDIVNRGWNELWMEFMDREADGHRPPGVLLGVASLAVKPMLYEVEVWAMVSK